MNNVEKEFNFQQVVQCKFIVAVVVKRKSEMTQDSVHRLTRTFYDLDLSSWSLVTSFLLQLKPVRYTYSHDICVCPVNEYHDVTLFSHCSSKY